MNNKGIWISNEILSDNRLDLSDKVVLAIYQYYTINGSEHCCLLTNDRLANMIGISVPTVQRAKKKLKGLDLIQTNGGIKVWYKGYQNDVGGYQNDTPRGIKMIGEGYQNDTHNKERIKRINKDNNNTYNISTSIADDDDWMLPSTDDVVKVIIKDIKAGRILTEDQLNIRCRIDGVAGVEKDLIPLLPKLSGLELEIANL